MAESPAERKMGFGLSLKPLYVGLAGLALAASMACGTGATPTPLPTSTPRATPTLEAIATATPTRRPEPSPTPTYFNTATPTPVAVATPTATAALPTSTPFATFTPVPPKPECLGCEEAFSIIWNFGRPVAEAISQQPWFKDGVNAEDAVFINSLRNKFGVPEIYDIVAAPQSHFVHGSIDTLLGKRNIAVLYVPEQYIEGRGLVLTDKRTAENVLSFYMADNPLLESYFEASPFANFNPPDSPSNMYTIFINIKNRANGPGNINTLSNKSIFTHAHEDVHRYDLGVSWLNEGSATFVGLKNVEKLAAENPDWFREFNEVPGVRQLTVNAVNDYYGQDSLQVKLHSAERYIKGQGLVPVPWPNNIPPPESVPLYEIPMEEMLDYKVGENSQGQVGFVFLADLERLLGEDAMREGYRELIRATDKRGKQGLVTGTLPTKDAYGIFRHYAPADKLQPFDELWKTRVFGAERFVQIQK
ncbi:hypothetical protein HYV83_02575 [Candidatus Woesearchaeota archaeon]|nr:hypothetical protein [Candidatus Woesearchaeota archaeon]